MPDDTLREIAFSEYPITLQNMHNPPKKFYLRGRLAESPDQKYLCIVGSRRWTSYGRDAVNKIVAGLRGYPITIVSGLAIGIDSIAHMAALEAGMHCIAFPGSSLDWSKIYPHKHTKLAKKIIEGGGALMSRWDAEYPMGKWAFPARNEFMAGISHATLVVEAGRRSGSLMTAKHAERMDRDVLAIPGSINASQSYGPHMLIKNGAALIGSPEDALEALGFQVPEGGIARSRERLATLDELSAKIMHRLSFEEMTIDSLVDKIGAPISDINEKMTLLELGGFVRLEDGRAKIM